MITWKLENWKIKDLKPHPKNPRKLSKHDAAHLKRSLDKFGLIDKPIITKDGLIIGGHQRVSILKKMKFKEVECYVPDIEMTEKDIKNLMVSLNRVHGDFDYDILANNFEIEELIDYGFTPEELHIDQVQDLGSEQESKEKKNKCPACGHEF